MPVACTTCGAELETPLGCAACGSLFEVAPDSDPFALFGLEPAFAVDAEPLRKRLLRFSRMTHPDFYAGRPEEALAEANTALLNRAYELLVDDVRRADWMVTAAGGPSESDERSMPQVFLMEVLEWNETLEEARSSADVDLTSLERELREKRAEELSAIESKLSPIPADEAPEWTEVRRHLNAVRYLDRALSQIAELSLNRASSS